MAREVLGGNGVVADFHVAKQFCDMEAIYTYEVGALTCQVSAGNAYAHRALRG